MAIAGEGVLSVCGYINITVLKSLVMEQSTVVDIYVCHTTRFYFQYAHQSCCVETAYGII